MSNERQVEMKTVFQGVHENFLEKLFGKNPTEIWQTTRNKSLHIEGDFFTSYNLLRKAMGSEETDVINSEEPLIR